MKIEEKTTKSFQPFEISIKIESQEESNSIMAGLGYISVSTIFRNAQLPSDLINIDRSFFGKFQSEIYRILKNNKK